MNNPREDKELVCLPATRAGAELRLLLACLRWPLDEAARQYLRALITDNLDWSLFAALTDRHRVQPLVENALRQSGVAPPPEIQAALRRAAAEASWSELRLVGELKALLTQMHAAGLRPIVLKGPALAIRAYGRLGLRYNRDLDLLIEQRDIAAACEILENSGFLRIEPAADIGEAGLKRWLRRQKDLVYDNPEHYQIVELHWRLFDNPNLLPLENRNIRGREVLLPDFSIDTLPDTLDMIFICVHGAQHAWSRLKWIADLNALLAPMSAEQMLSLHQAARAHKVQRATAQAMLLCARLFGRPIPTSLLVEAKRDWRIRALDGLARRLIIRSGAAEIESLPLGSTLKNISHYLLTGGFRYLLSEAYFDLTDLSAERTQNLPRYLLPLSRLYFWGQRHAARLRRS